jgi:hypothetical protein
MCICYFLGKSIKYVLNKPGEKDMLYTKVNVNFNTDITLDKYRLWYMEGDRRGDLISCIFGRLWITQDGDLKDYVLEPGQEFWITRAGTVIVQALDKSKFKFSLNEVHNHVESNHQPIHLSLHSRTSQRVR